MKQGKKHFLPLTEKEYRKLHGEQQPDFVFVTGDAYVDHPSFGMALIGRLLEDEGYRVAIIAQPDWRRCDDFTRFGRPKIAFLLSAGNLDSMVSHYTAARRPRRGDDFSPGGVAGKRPDRALIAYTSRIRQAYKGIRVIIGGIEASLRRLCHYDYWSNSFRRSVLLDAKADYLLYGMSELVCLELAALLQECDKAEREPRDEELAEIRGLVWLAKEEPTSYDTIKLPAYDNIKIDPPLYAKHFAVQLKHADPFSAKHLIEEYGGRFCIQNPSPFPLSSRELDRVYELPYLRRAHPSYEAQGGVPALKEVQFSLVSSRGCFGGCSFCALTFHQGRIITARSRDSLLREARFLIEDPDFKGYIHDVGGPTANFRQPACRAQRKRGACPDRQCLYPEPCKALEADHSDYIQLLRSLRQLPGVKKVFIRSGIRFDYLLEDKDDSFLRELVRHHISGQLKVAPEHAAAKTLAAMGKPPISVYEEFSRRFYRETEKAGKKQYLIPYLIAGHPGSGLKEAIELALFLKKSGFVPDQVQDFYPTPGTVSSCMWASGIDPRNGKSIYVARTQGERNMQRALLQFNKPKNYAKVRKALRQAGRGDLIGRGPGALVPPESHKQKRQRKR